MHKEFCVITPYDAQRAAITAALDAAGVARFEHVYNVDSFQGRHRILSVHMCIKVY